MTDDELRLAAGALLAEIDTYAHNRCGHGLPLDAEHMAGLVAVVRLYLAGRGAADADDGEPITPSWLIDVHAHQINSIARHWIIATRDQRFDVMYFPKDDTLRLYTANLNCDGTTSGGGCHIVAVHPTRGHVRRLCAALGFPTESRP